MVEQHIPCSTQNSPLILTPILYLSSDISHICVYMENYSTSQNYLKQNSSIPFLNDILHVLMFYNPCKIHNVIPCNGSRYQTTHLLLYPEPTADPDSNSPLVLGDDGTVSSALNCNSDDVDGDLDSCTCVLLV